MQERAVLEKLFNQYEVVTDADNGYRDVETVKKVTT